MLDLGQLEALAAAVSEGTFEGAAGRLHVTPSAISQRIKALETSVGRVLLTRTKPIQTTASGETLLRAARQIQAITTEAMDELGGDTSGHAPVIPVAANADSLATWLVPALGAVVPELVVDVRRSDETRTAELLRAGTVMAAVTASAEPVPGCTVELLGRMPYRPRAAPGFAARWFETGATIENLARAPVVCFDREDQTQDAYLRRRTRRRLDPPRHYIPGSEGFAQAVALGLGWGMVPDLQAADHDLVVFDPRGSIDIRLHWQQWRLRSAALDRLADAVRRQAAAVLD
jgi:LysR family transcriptional regulator (chromosome initiation inhibitor)